MGEQAAILKRADRERIRAAVFGVIEEVRITERTSREDGYIDKRGIANLMSVSVRFVEHQVLPRLNEHKIPGTKKKLYRRADVLSLIECTREGDDALMKALFE